MYHAVKRKARVSMAILVAVSSPGLVRRVSEVPGNLNSQHLLLCCSKLLYMTTPYSIYRSPPTKPFPCAVGVRSYRNRGKSRGSTAEAAGRTNANTTCGGTVDFAVSRCFGLFVFYTLTHYCAVHPRRRESVYSSKNVYRGV